MFDLKRPCGSCPFRKGNGEKFGLNKERLDEIVHGASFQCHKTVNYEEYEDQYLRQGDNPQQCAGLMAVLHREGMPNQIMQVAERLNSLDCNELDPRNEAYETLADAMSAHLGE